MRSRSATTHMRSMLQQSQAALLVLVFIAGQVGSYVHAAIEQHAVCPEHGEIIHVPGHGLPAPGKTDQAVPASEPRGEPRGERDALRDGSAAGADHAHDHCYLCPASRERLAPGQSSDAVAAVIPAAVHHALPAVVTPGSRARYIIAPKTSPPV